MSLVDFNSAVDISALARLVHERNKKWWINIETGEPISRNYGELIALVHSELSEAWCAYSCDLADEHLPKFPGVMVELSDVLIRLLDIMGGLFKEQTTDFMLVISATAGLELEPEGDSVLTVSDTSFQRNCKRLLQIHHFLSHSLELNRKGQPIGSQFAALVDAFYLTALLGNDLGSNLGEVFEAKLAYNAKRADHQLENRRKADGKKY